MHRSAASPAHAARHAHAGLGGDTKTAFFLGDLLSHLDLPSVSKSDAIQIFEPLLNTMDLNDLGQIYENPWRPRSALTGMEALLDPDGARTYVQRIQDFRQGNIGKDDIATGLSRELNRTSGEAAL